MSTRLPEGLDLEEWRRLPQLERVKIQAQHWGEYGFGTPTGAYLFYVVKIVAYVAVPLWIISITTPGIGALSELGTWWTEPIVLQKFVLWTVLFEVMGLGCGSGPLTMRFVPPIGGVLYWVQPGTVRLPPWPTKIPLTSGDRRSVFDVVVYVALLVTLGYGLVSDGVERGGIGGGATVDIATGAVGDPGMVAWYIPLVAVGLVALLGLRDKTIYLAARSDQYLLMMLAFLLPLTDQVIALKLVMIAIWWGAATSKLNHHFPFVVAVMISNAPAIPSRWIKRKLFRQFPDDMRPSGFAKVAAHQGTVIEYLFPLVLIVSTNATVTFLALLVITIFHLFIMSTVPAGVPLEWNVFVILGAWYLFYGYSGADYVLWNSESPWPYLFAAVLVAGIVVGNTKPEWVSFLVGMRYYAGNWATNTWLVRPEIEERIDTEFKKVAKVAKPQLTAIYGEPTAEFMVQKFTAWRGLHSHGRGHLALIGRAVRDREEYLIREGETYAGALLGWNFGEGHLHNEQLIGVVHNRLGLSDGDLRVVMMEGQPIHRRHQAYKIVDAASGLIEEGYIEVADMIDRQPWLDESGSIPLTVTYSAADRARDDTDADGRGDTEGTKGRV